MKLPLLSVCLMFGACLEPRFGDQDARSTNGPIETEDVVTTHTPNDDAATNDPTNPNPDAVGECKASGAECTASSQCCAGTFCTFDPISYMQSGVCSAPLPEGSYCVEANWCASHNCRNNTCGSSECLDEGRECQGDWGCCNDLFCSGGAYVYGECHARRALGEPCGEDGWCQSGLCRDGACAVEGCAAVGDGCQGAGDCCSGYCTGSPDSYVLRICATKQPDGYVCWADNDCASDICRDGLCAADCQAANEGCWWDDDCCADTFCEYREGSDSLYSSECTPKRDAGATCDWDHACKTGLCRDGKCQAEGCLASEVQCFSDAECCTGACSYSSMSYAEGRCFSPMAAGSVCERDAWCASGKCADGFCK